MIVGLVGKPSAGKSTLFKALTLAEVEIAPYPFTTIGKNEGVGFVKIRCAENEFKVKCDPKQGYCLEGNRFVPVRMIDVAGLVPGAHEGKGMGNQFLDDLRQANVLIHVVDASGATNEKGEQVPIGSHNPAKDIKFLEAEIDMWYLGILKKGWEKFARTIQQEKKEIEKAIAKQLSGLGVNEDMAKAVVKKLALNKEEVTSWSEDDLRNLAVEFRKRTKPMIIACNKVDIKEGKDNYEKLKKEFNDYIVVACSAESELALREAAKHEIIEYIPGESDFKIVNGEKLNEKQKKALEFIKKNILEVFKSTGAQQVIDSAVFDLLKYIAIFPGGVNKLADSDGNVLPDCFLLKGASTALDFAYRLHTDLGDKFIRAIDVKTKKTVGKDHVLKHLDVVEIITAR